MTLRTLLVAALSFLGSIVLLGQVPIEERIPLRDPDRLEALGFPRDATNVYVWSKARGTKSVENVPGDERPDAPDTFGTTDSGFTPVAGIHLEGNSNFVKGFVVAHGGVVCDEASLSSLAYAQLPVPEGALLEFVRAWTIDMNAEEDINLDVVESCLPTFSAGPATFTILGSFGTSGATGSGSPVFDLNGLTANNRDCVYFCRVDFSAGEAGTTCHGAELILYKLRLQWRRQISQAPLVATFGDVPTDHLYFRAIEALSASGITQGCGSGNFCPAGNVTRGEMAAFLARALGLHWP